MSGQRKPGDVVPLKTKIRPGIAWPELTQGGSPKKGSMMNTRKAIAELGLDVGYDVFLGRYTVQGSDMQAFVGEVNDKVARKLRELSFQKFGYEPGAEAAREGLMRACEEHMHDSVRDYLDGLEWDRVERLDTWLTTYLGVDDTPLHRAWGTIFLTAAVRRVYDPGCKFDHVLVLEGPEGADKSTTVQVLACGHAGDRPEYFSDSGILHKTEKEQQELTKGVWFYEIAELAGMRTADQHAVKAFITRQEERARPAYGYFKENQPRVAVFIGTFNTDADTGDLVEYLNPGDRRRWWPVRVGKIDIPALVHDRDQLLAEAKVNHELEASLKLASSLWDDAAVEQKQREVSNPLADRLSTLYSELTANPPPFAHGNGVPLARGRDYMVSDREVWVSAKVVIERLPPNLTTDGRKVATAMRKNGWRAVNDRRTGDQTRGYVRNI
jgi:putative DNA primase/helicase